MTSAIVASRGAERLAIVAAERDEPGGSGGGSTPVIPVVPVASFQTQDFTMIEGQTVPITCKLSLASDRVTYVVPILLDSSSGMDASGVTLSDDFFVFQPGVLTSTIEVTVPPTAVTGGPGTLTYSLSPKGAEAIGGNELVPVIGDGFGRTTLDITVQDLVVVAPVLEFTSATATVAEGSSGDLFVASLSSPATDVVTVRFYTEAIDALPDVDFVPVDVEVQIAVGESTAGVVVQFPDNLVQAASDPQVRLRAEVVSGTATLGGVGSVVITIVDNDAGGVGGSGAPVAQFGLLPQTTLNEGESVDVMVRLASGNGTPLAFTKQVEIPLARTGDDADFLIEFDGSDDTLVFEAQQSVAMFRVTATDDGDGELLGEVTFEIQEDPTGDARWTVGTRDTVTLTAQEAAQEPTELFMDTMDTSDGVRVARQFSTAVVPPSFTLQPREVAGETVQTVGHKRDAVGRWVSQYHYAMEGGAESTPGEAGAVQVTNEGTPTLPPESGQFVDPPALEFEAVLADGQAYFATIDGGGQAIEDWTSPTGKWPQVGADLVRERVFTMRLRRQGTTGSFLDPSGDVFGLFNVVEKRIAGEDDLVIYAGRLAQGAWKEGEEPLEENDWCDGAFQLRYLLGNAPSGWSFVVPERHALQRSITASREMLLDDPGTDHEFLAGEPYHFWFILQRNGSSAAASQRAIHYFHQRHIAFVNGGLGPQRHEYYDDLGECTIDWNRAPTEDGGNVGWAAIREVQRDIYLERGGIQSYQNQWISGNSGSFMRNRIGWLHPAGPEDGNGGGGELIDGAYAVRPYHPYWYHARMIMAGTTGKHPNCFRDVTSGEALWLWNVAHQVNGEWRHPVQHNMNNSFGSVIHYHHLGPPSEIPASDVRTGGTETGTNGVAQFRLAPTTRTWHTSIPGREDPNAAARRAQKAFDFAHMSRLRQAFIDNWMGCRDPFAFMAWEEMCAQISRTLATLREGPDFLNDFDRKNSNFAYIKSQRLNPDPHQGRGYWRAGTNEYISNQNHRSWGWPGLVMAGFYACATDDLRANLRGEGKAATRNVGAWGPAYVEFLAYTTTEPGLPFAMFSSANAPWIEGSNADGTRVYGVTDIATQTGAYPDLNNVGSPGQVGMVSKSFFTIFNTGGLAAVVRWMIEPPSGDGDAPHLDKVPQNLKESLRWAYHHQIGMRAKGVPPQRRTNEHVIAGIDNAKFPANDSAPALNRFSIPEVHQGQNAWALVNLNTTEGRPDQQNPLQADASYGPQGAKWGWLATIAMGMYDESYVSLSQYLEAREGDTIQQYIDHLMNGGANGQIASGIFGGGTDKRRTGMGEHTWQIPLVARLLNLIS